MVSLSVFDCYCHYNTHLKKMWCTSSDHFRFLRDVCLTNLKVFFFGILVMDELPVDKTFFCSIKSVVNDVCTDVTIFVGLTIFTELF